MHGVTSWTNFVERISCPGTKTKAPLHIYTFDISNRVHSDFKEYVKTSLSYPLQSVLKGVHAPASKPLLEQCRNLIKRLNELRSLINQAPNVCSIFQGLIVTKLLSMLFFHPWPTQKNSYTEVAHSLKSLPTLAMQATEKKDINDSNNLRYYTKTLPCFQWSSNFWLATPGYA